MGYLADNKVHQEPTNAYLFQDAQMDQSHLLTDIQIRIADYGYLLISDI
jgi:hypothetical protein